MRIIPAIDILNGKCVRLTKGDYGSQKIYNENPLEVAKEFEANGIKYLHLVDLDGAKAKTVINYSILHDISSKTSLKIDFGGGINTDEDLNIAFENGASQVTVGSIAVNNETIFLEWLQRFGADKIILGADCNNRKIVSDAWTSNSEVEVIEFVSEYSDKGVKYVICTDVSKDGMLAGPSVDLYSGILSKTDVELIASGGVSNIKDIVALEKIGCEGVIIGKAIYEGKISLNKLQQIC